MASLRRAADSGSDRASPSPTSSQSDGSLGIDPTEILNDLRESLDAIRSGGTFASGGATSFTDPQIHVDGIGTISLPLTEEHARALVRASHRAPFGKGDQTIVDTSVRKTWELNCDQFELRRPDWQRYLTQVLEHVAYDLGISAGYRSIRPDLYKMLLYEPGAMFKAHKDSEKAPGMFGTLVISLPSAHTGGAVKLRHAGQSKHFETERSEQSFICWYSDVTHEVTEITSGYRLVLTYNLINVSPSAPVSATSLRAETRNLRAVFKAWNKDLDEAGDIGEECIYYLNHEYTEASLHYRALKGKDMAKARALKEVCDETGFCFFLATLERMVQGGCDESYDDFGYGFEEEYNSDEEEEYSGYSSCRTYGDHHDLTEIYQEELKLKRVVDLDGNIVAEDVAVDEEKILADAPYEDREPDAEDFSGFTGNEGVSATHWYRDAVLIIMPRSAVANFLFAQFEYDYTLNHMFRFRGPQDTYTAIRIIDYFEREWSNTQSTYAKEHLSYACSEALRREESKQNGRSNEVLERIIEVSESLKDVELFEKTVALVEEELSPGAILVIELFLRRVGFARLQKGIETALTHPRPRMIHKFHFVMTGLFQLYDDPDCMERPKTLPDPEWSTRMYKKALDDAEDIGVEDAKALVRMLSMPGGVNLYLERVVSLVTNNIDRTAFVITFLTRLFGSGQSHTIDEATASSTFRTILRTFLPKISLSRQEVREHHQKPNSYGYHSFQYSQAGERATEVHTTTQDGNQITVLIRQMYTLKLEDEIEVMVEKLKSQAEIVDPPDYSKVLFPFLHSLSAVLVDLGISLTDPKFQSLYQTILKLYLKRYVGVEPPRPSDWVRDKVFPHCTDCESLNRFLANPTECEGRFSVAEKRRKHLERTLGSDDYIFLTERRGSPYTLVIRKTDRAYQRDRSAWRGRGEVADGEIAQLGRAVDLHQLLGDQYRVIMEKKVTKLRASSSATSAVAPLKVARPSTEPLARGTGNLQSPAAGRKRKLEIVDLTEDD